MADVNTTAEKLGHESIELRPSDIFNGSLELEWSEEEEAVVRKKLDMTIVPAVTFLYLLCFIDRANIGNARIEGLTEDLGLVGYQFNEALSIFYIMYLVVEIPSNILLKRFGGHYVIPTLVGGFGFISLCTAFVQSFPGLCVARAFLAVFEGGTMPGIAFYLSCFYKRSELFLRIGIFVSASALAGAFGGLLATALSLVPEWGIHSMPIHSWRNIFFFEGLFTTLCAILSLLFIPSAPNTCSFFNERQRSIAAERLRREHEANANERVTLHHVKRAIFNVNTNVCAWSFFCTNITVQGLASFMPTVLKDLGWTSTKAQLYSVPPYVVATAATIMVAWVSDKMKLRGPWIILPLLFSVTGFGVLRWSIDVHARYMAVFFCAIGGFAASSGFLSWGLNNTPSPAARAVTGAYIVAIASLGGVLSTWTYLPYQAPRYIAGITINFVAQIACVCIVSFGTVHVLYENRMRARGKRDHRLLNLTEGEKDGLAHRHPSFRYIP